MPKIDPTTGEALSDDPIQEDDTLRGGKRLGDAGLKGTTENGATSRFEKHRQPSTELLAPAPLPGERETKGSE